MEFTNIDGFSIVGRAGYAMDALAYGKANPGQVFKFDHSSANAAGRLRALGLTVKSSARKDAEGKFQSVYLEAVYNADSKEVRKAAELAANPKPKKVKDPNASKKSKSKTPKA